jgi:hypothetical protein
MKTAQRLATVVVAMGGLCLTVNDAGAQSATPSPFHAGQWGIEGYASGTTGGLLRFITPRTAIVLDVSGTHTRSTSSATPILPGDFAKYTSDEFNVALGLRRHVMAAPRMAVTYGVGGLVGTLQQRNEYSGQSANSDHRSYFGGFADVGGQFMVTDRFAVGLSYRLRLQHNNRSIDDQSGNLISTSFMPIRATLYF